MAIVLVGGPGTAPAAADLPHVGVNAGAPISGDSILFTDALAADIASSGCRLVRINFIVGGPEWTAQRLAKYDQIIANARNHDLQVLAVFSNETVAGTQPQWNENYNTTGLNAYVTSYAETAYMLIDRYKDDVKLFELWNEPSCWSVNPATNPLNPGCSYIWPRIFANLTAETYKECVEQGGATFFADNGVILVSGGLFAHDIAGSFSTAMDYMQDVYQQDDVWDAFETDPFNPSGRRYPWDYLGYHFYLNQGSAVSTTELNSYFNHVRSTQSAYSDSSDVMVTEFGWTTEGVGDQGKADNLTASYDWMRTRPFIVSAIWYQYNCCDPNGNWGLTNGIGNYQPAWYAFAAQCGQVGAPVANFNGFPLSGAAPLTVSFADQSSGIIDTYAWQFGDGDSSGQANPEHTYTQTGLYTVTLTVAGPGGSDAETRVDYVSVDPAPLEGDLDDDGNVDLYDYARFAQCYTGAGQTIVPAGCETDGEVVVPVATSFESAGSLTGLSRGLQSADLLAGAVGTVEAGGFYEGLNPSADLGDLTDGVAGGGTEAVLADYLRPSLQVRYDLSPPRALEAIRVFAATSDGRVFQNYDVYYSVEGDTDYDLLVGDVTSGPFGQINNGSIGATLTEVTGSTAGPVAVGVDALRFAFYDVSTVSPANVFWDEWDTQEPGDTDGNPRAYVGSIIKEIDVDEYTGPVVTNAADLDGDGDADVDDFALLAENLSPTGP